MILMPNMGRFGSGSHPYLINHLSSLTFQGFVNSSARVVSQLLLAALVQ